MKNFLRIILCVVMSANAGSVQGQGCFTYADDGALKLNDYKEFDAQKVFLVGEFHGVYSVPAVKLALIKYVHEHNGVNDVFMEIGYATAWLYNQYLLTGDTSLFTDPELTYARKKVNKDFWKSLYAYNQTQRHKLAIHGMDFERWDFLKALKLMIPVHGTSEDSGRLPRVRINEAPNDRLVKVYDSLRNDLALNRDKYRELYGSNFDAAERIMTNDNTYGNYKARNKRMYENVMKEVREEKIKRFILFCGLNHANKNGGYTLCSRLVNDWKLKGPVTTISMLCEHCYDWQQSAENNYAAFRGPLTYVSDTGKMSGLFKAYYNSACDLTLLPATYVKDSVVNAFSDHLLLMKDQPEF